MSTSIVTRHLRWDQRRPGGGRAEYGVQPASGFHDLRPEQCLSCDYRDGGPVPDPSLLSLLYVHSSSGQLVPLNAVSKLTYDVGPLSINHLGQLPAVTISFNLRPGVSL